MRINFEMLDLRALLAVSEMRSFRRAAESLGLSQPALSRRIRALETSVGTPLLERSTRRVAPTTGADDASSSRRFVRLYPVADGGRLEVRGPGQYRIHSNGSYLLSPARH